MRKIIITLMLAMSGGCFANENPDSGNVLYRFCKDDHSQCNSFVAGVMQGTYTTLALAGLSKDQAQVNRILGYCPPDGYDYAQATDIFINYLEKHPEARHHLSAILAAKSWREAWPCK